MKRLLVVAALTLPVLSACGEKEERPYFQVMGEAKIERQAELFLISLHISERGKDKQKSMEAAAVKLDQMRKSLSELEGLERVKIRTSDAKTDTVRPPGCYPEELSYDDTPDYPKNCDPVEFVSSVQMAVEGEPASAAGAALSMLTELKAEKVALAGYGVKDPEKAQMEVRRLAVENARNAARGMAEQAGARLGQPIEIKYGEDFDEDRFRLGERPDEEEVDAIIVSIPARPFWLPPNTVKFETQVAVKFALEQPKAEK